MKSCRGGRPRARQNTSACGSKNILDQLRLVCEAIIVEGNHVTNSKTFVLPRVGSTRANLRKIVSCDFQMVSWAVSFVVPRVVCEVPDGVQFAEHVLSRVSRRAHGPVSDVDHGRIYVCSKATASRLFGLPGLLDVALLSAVTTHRAKNQLFIAMRVAATCCCCCN